MFLLAHPGSGSTTLKLVKFPLRRVEVQRPLGYPFGPFQLFSLF